MTTEQKIGPQSDADEAKLLEIIERNGAAVVAGWLAKARSRRTPAQASLAVIYFGVLFLERRGINPATRERDPIISRRAIFRALAAMSAQLPTGRSPKTAGGFKTAFDRAAAIAQTDTGREQLRRALLAVMPAVRGEPLYQALIFGEEHRFMIRQKEAPAAA